MFDLWGESRICCCVGILRIRFRPFSPRRVLQRITRQRDRAQHVQQLALHKTSRGETAARNTTAIYICPSLSSLIYSTSFIHCRIKIFHLSIFLYLDFTFNLIPLATNYLSILSPSIFLLPLILLPPSSPPSLLTSLAPLLAPPSLLSASLPLSLSTSPAPSSHPDRKSVV